jgi:import inner membrane translocase subunit TIM44
VAGETEESIALQAIRRLDDQFDKEEFLAEVRDNLVPRVIKAHLGGDFKVLRDWCGEGVYNKLAADIRTRKNDKLEFNDSILNVDEMEAVFKVNDQDNVPYVIVGYQVQQINCIKKAGEIIEVRPCVPLSIVSCVREWFTR